MALTDGLISYWNCDEIAGSTCEDTLNVNDGVINGATINQTGKLNKAYTSDGTADYVETGQCAINTTFTFNCWFKLNAAGSGHCAIFSQGLGNVNDWLKLGIQDTFKIHIEIRNGGVPKIAENPTAATYNDATWRMVTLVGNSSTANFKLYINGGDPIWDKTVAALTLNTFSDYGGFGHYYVDDTTKWDKYAGSMDEFGLWNRVLTPAEITSLYNSGNGLAYPFGADYTKLQINIGDVWKVCAGMQINIGDVWKVCAGMKINIGDSWKTIF